MAAKNAAAGAIKAPQMGAGLNSSKSQLKDALEKILYAAYYNAEMETLGSAGEEPTIFAMVQKTLENAVEKKAKKFSSDAAGPLADTICNFVLSANFMINAIIPTHGAVSSPVGPCAGTIAGDVNSAIIKIL